MNCEKKSFINKEEAVKRIEEIKSQEGKNKKPIRSYRCEKCGNFHLTSWSKKVKKIVENKKIIKEITKLENEAEYCKMKKGW